MKPRPKQLPQEQNPALVASDGDQLVQIKVWLLAETYHRAWVSEMFFDAGATPPETDLSVFLTEQQTALAA
jgi:hypothetical protein